MTLEPVFKQLGVAWKKPWPVYARAIRVAFLLLIFTVFIAILLDALFNRSLVIVR